MSFGRLSAPVPVRGVEVEVLESKTPRKLALLQTLIDLDGWDIGSAAAVVVAPDSWILAWLAAGLRRHGNQGE